MSKDKIGAITRVAVGINHEHHGIALDVLNRLNSGDAAAWAARFAAVVRQGLPPVSPAPYLQKISSGIKLGATTGARTIAGAKEISGYVDKDFADWGLDVPASPTGDTLVEVHEQIKDGAFASIFGSFGRILDDLCFTQDQIISFVEAHQEWLHPKQGTFFLFKVCGELFVANVSRRSDGLLVAIVHHYSGSYVRLAVYRDRFVVPQEWYRQ